MQSATEKPPSGRAWDNLPPQESGSTDRGLVQRVRSKLVRMIPRPLVRALAGPYVAGETRAEAVALVRRLQGTRRLFSTVDVLGEDIKEPEEAREMLEEYLAILEDLGGSPYANISVKLSALGQALSEEMCAENLEILLLRAADRGVFVRFDMEDHTTTDSTLRLYRRFVARYPGIGPVLQSRLHRTEQDIQALAPLKPNVRLCIGIYHEPSDISLTDKRAMKERLLQLLELMWSNDQYVAIATHDEAVIHRALALADRMGKTAADYEVQMLLGVPRAEIQGEVQLRGVKVRLYVPYGRHWYAYCLRRLDGNPEMARMVIGNLLRRRSR